MNRIEQIEITGLHGARNVALPFRDQHCILIGPNGSGKSTALQIVAYGLGRQWRSLAEQNFDSLTFSFEGGKKATISRVDCLEVLKVTHRNPARHLYFDLGSPENLWNFDFADPDVLRELTRLGVSPADIQSAQRRTGGTTDAKAAQKRVRTFGDALSEVGIPLTMYLPTYRRIELELKKLLGTVPEQYRKAIEASQLKTSKDDFIAEIVRFGMEDVSSKISLFERETRDFARNKFNRMMASYLKEMANSQVLSVRELRDIVIDENTINVTLSRIEEGLLDPEEKSKISSILLEMASGQAGGHPPFYKKWLAHFFAKLHAVNQEIEAKEASMRALLSTLGRYLAPKKLSYSIEDYHFSISDEHDRELTLADLSSGEKQVASLLTEIYFRGDGFNFLIDEPELSLSVPWQTEILVDVIKSPYCNQLVAVTHSPFIYDNSLQSSVIDFSRASS